MHTQSFVLFSADNSFYSNVKMNVLYPTNLYVPFMTHWIKRIEKDAKIQRTQR